MKHSRFRLQAMCIGRRRTKSDRIEKIALMIVSLISSLRVVTLRDFRHCSHMPARVHNDDSAISTPSKTICVADAFFCR